MTIPFYKYHGTGNDFIIINAYNDSDFSVDDKWISMACHRRFGIGADGLIIIYPSEKFDFKMKYFNSDGFEGTMCGNGGRCVVSFAKKLGIISEKAQFEAIDGVHYADIMNNGEIKLKMNDVDQVKVLEDGYILDTGSPHFVKFVDDLYLINVFAEGKKTRNQKRFLPHGVNVNFVQIINDNTISMATYERGVEDETLSCGTGSVASALAFGIKRNLFNSPVCINSKGGKLLVFYEHAEKGFKEILLQGSASFVYEGEINFQILD
ncbi:MAG: diaminopimelate epimerase [Bacteroidota bacterium]